jgi:hypothetical protein
MLKLVNALFVAAMNRFETSYSFSEKELDLQWHYKDSKRHWWVRSRWPFVQTYAEASHIREFDCLIDHLGGSALLNGLWDLPLEAQQKVVDEWVKDYSKEELEEICQKVEAERMNVAGIGDVYDADGQSYCEKYSPKDLIPFLAERAQEMSELKKNDPRTPTNWDKQKCFPCGHDRWCGRDSHRPDFAVDEDNGTIFFDE